MNRIRISNIPEGGIVELNANDIAIMISKLSGTVTALESTCTHKGCDVAFGEISRNEIICPDCGSRYDLITGEVKGGPATKPLKKHDVRILGDEVLVD